MRISTRVLVSLLPTVGVIMLVYAGWSLIERENTMTGEARRQTESYATALALAFEYGLHDVRPAQVQGIIDEVAHTPSVYGILVYDAHGRRLYSSDPLRAPGSAARSELDRVLQRGESMTLQREIDDQKMFSVLRPIRNVSGQITGALEVVQPLTRIGAEKTKVQRRYILNTLTLFAALTLVSLLLIRGTVGKPMSLLVRAARAVGRGELGYRITTEAESGELADLAREFNTMADSLQTARSDVLRQAEERVALERRLRESEKLAAVGTLATGVAHDIAAPLNVISGRAEMLLRRGDLPPAERERYLRIIVKSSARITTIVRSLLNFARRHQARVARVDLAAVIDGVADAFEGEFAASGVRMEREDPRPLMALGDPDLLHQVFVNLVLNAMQAMEETASPERRLVVWGETAETQAGRVVHIDVSDTGPGVPVELREQVFSPFFTTKARGTGLGLSLARTMVEEQGGTIAVVSEVGAPRGATFRITLPAAAVTARSGRKSSELSRMVLTMLISSLSPTKLYTCGKTPSSGRHTP